MNLIFLSEMKKVKLHLTLLVLIISSQVQSQHTWVNLDSPTQKNLNSVDFISDNIGIVVGDNGTILRTTDGGLNWDQIVNSTSNDLRGVSFTGSNTVFAVGTGSTVIKSNDQGLSWTPVTIPGIYYDLNDIAIGHVFGNGIITGQTNAIIATDDFGETWSIVQDGYMSDFFETELFPEAGGVVIGWNSIFQPLLGYSVNGQDWDYCNFYPTWGGVMYEGVAKGGRFSDSNSGFIVGTYFVPGGGFLAAFGGWSNNSWNAQSFPEPLNDIDFLDLFAVTIGNNGYIAESEDGGINWNSLNLNLSPSDLNAVYLTGNSGYIVGNDGVILKKVSSISIHGYDNKIKCFPNPCKNALSIKWPENNAIMHLEILNLSGVKVFEKEIQSIEEQISLNVENLEPGFYILRLITEDQFFTHHFVKY